MASKHIKTETIGGVVLIHILHLDTDSFTRSVERAANKRWRALPHDVRVRTTFTHAEFAHTTQGRHCTSTVGYGPSFDAVRDALDHILSTDGEQQEEKEQPIDTDYTLIGVIESLRRYQNSESGNPRYGIVLRTWDGATRTLRTESDAAVGHTIGRWWEGSRVKLTLRNDRVIGAEQFDPDPEGVPG